MKFARYLPIAMLLALFIGIQMPTASAQNDTTGVTWNSVYYNNSYLGEPAIYSRQESSIAFDWGTGSPANVVNSDYFSARYTTTFNFTDDFYRFRVVADDGVRVIIDNSITLIDTFDNPQPGDIFIADTDMSAGVHTIQVDYREVTGIALLQAGWQPISNPGETKYIPPANNGVTVLTTDAISPASNWTASYYANANLSGNPAAIVTELDPSHNWGVGAPVPNVPADNFSAQWTSNVYLSGTYTVTVRADDGVRVYVDGEAIIDEWHPANNQTFSRIFTVAEGNHTIAVQYYEAGGVAFLDYDLSPTNTAVANPQPLTNPASNWLVQYYNNAGLLGDPVLTQSEDRVSRTWGYGAPISSMSPDQFSVRFTSTRNFEAGNYLLRVKVDDGVRVYVDNVPYIDEWHLSNGSAQYTATVPLTAGSHTITIEYYENTENAFIEYSLDPVSTTTVPTTIAGTPIVEGDPATATVIASLLNLRSEPNAFAPILDKLSRGETYPILGENSNGTWIQINVDGQIGWVNSTYTDEFNYNNIPIIDETVVDTPDIGGYYAITTANLNMRSGPGLEYNVIRIIPDNSRIDLEARTIDADWWQVSYGGSIGWVTEAFINLSPSVNLSDYVIVP